MTTTDSGDFAPAASFRRPWLLPWHPLGFAAAWVLNAYVAIAISPYAMFRALGVAIAGAAIAIGLGWLAARNLRGGALIATALVAFVVLGREIATVVRNAVTLLPTWQLVVLMVPLAGLIALTARVTWRSLHHRDAMTRWTRVFNAFAAILLIVVVVTAVASGTLGQTIGDLRQGVPLEAAPDRSDQPREGPDIYLILLDGYARADVLTQRFGFDGEPFLDALRERGFEVAPASHSNYTLTQLTLNSMFHMALVQDVPELRPVIDGAASEAVARRALNDNPTFAFVRSHGYMTVAFETPYEEVTLRQADVFIDGPQLTEFEWQLFASTFALDVLDGVAPTLLPDAQRARINSAFDHLAAVARDTTLGPKFVFAHVVAPHTPFVFGPNGEPLDVPVLRRTDDSASALGFSSAEFARRFTGQTTYVDGRAIAAIDAILAASPSPPVIIVMSDHGSRSRPLDPATATADDLRERFGTLFAAYTPGQTGVFPDDVTPAQVMVELFNAYFGTNFEQPAKGTFASIGNDPFAFTQVAEPPPPPD